MRFGSEGGWTEAKSRSHAFPEDVSANGESPTNGSPVVFGAAIIDEAQLKLFAAFKKLLQSVNGLC
jgi:hypothetical protein